MLAYEESEAQIVRNMRSAGIDLQPWLDEGLLHIHASRPSSHGLEMHLVSVHKLVEEIRPAALVMDPISNLTAVGSASEAKAMLVRLIDYLKSRGVTALYNSLTAPDGTMERSEVGVSSLIDTWLLVRQLETNGERNRTLFVLKSRGMSHSNQVREFLITDHGIDLRDAYLGPHGVLTGSARLAQEARERDEDIRREEERARDEAQLAARKLALEAQLAAIKAELENVNRNANRAASDDERRRKLAREDQAAMARSRRVADAPGKRSGG